MDNVQTSETARTPGAVLFVSILNFLSAAAGFFVAILCVALMALGASARFYEQITTDLAKANPPVTIPFGVAFFFLLVLGLSLVFGAFFLMIGLGLLKKKRFAWYLQVALSIVGLLGFPVGTLINGVILAFFFRSSTRSHFKV